MIAKTTHIIIFFFVCIIHAQNPVTLHLTEKDGLPDYEIYDIIEDHEGYIWIAANKGLYRFDGKVYKHFKHSEKRGLSVFGLIIDQKGRVWCNNISGQFFYIENDELNLFVDLKDQINGKLSEFKILDNYLYALTENGIIKVDLNNKSKFVLKDNQITSAYYHSPFVIDNEFYFVHASRIRKKNERDTFEDVASLQFNFTEINKINHIKINQQNIVSVTNKYSKLFLIDKSKSKDISPKELKDKVITKVIKVQDQLWIGTNKGVYLYQYKNEVLFFKSKYIEEEYITNIIVDKNQNHWIATLQNGIFVIPNIHIQKLDLLSDFKITELEKITDNIILFGTNDGKVGWFNTASLEVKTFSLPETSKISKIIYDELRNCIYIGQDKGGCFWNLNQKTIQPFNQIISAKTFSILDGQLIYGTYNNSQLIKLPKIRKINLFENLSTPVFLPKNIQFESTKIRNKRTYTSASKSSNYWIGYVDGIFYNNSTISDEIKFNNRSIFSVDLVIDNKDNLWASTFEDGLIQIRNNKIVANYNKENYLLSNYIGKIQLDGDKLWIITDSGIQLFDVSTKTFKSILKADGLETYDFIGLVATSTHLVLNTTKGVYLITKENCFKQFKTTDVFFTSVEINNKKLEVLDYYEVPYTDNELKISFNAIGFQKEEFLNYQFRLNNSEEWKDIENGIYFLKYNSLPPGNYTFEIRAINKNGVPSKSKKTTISILAPYWQKWWFYIVVSGLIVLLSWIAFIKKSKKKEKEQLLLFQNTKAEKELLFSQLENLRSQMNPHFIFNALNSIQEYIMTNDKELASTYLVKFSRLIRMYLNHSRNQEVILKDEIQALKLYLDLEKDRFDDTLEFTIEIEPKLLNQNIYVPSLFIQPYVENAIKHGLLHKLNNRKVSVKFYTLNNSLICEVEDNGIGRIESQKIKSKRAENHQSFATSANERRVDLLNKMLKNKINVTIQDLYSSINIASGTKVLIEIPIESYESNNN